MALHQILGGVIGASLLEVAYLGHVYAGIFRNSSFSKQEVSFLRLKILIRNENFKGVLQSWQIY